MSRKSIAGPSENDPSNPWVSRDLLARLTGVTTMRVAQVQTDHKLETVAGARGRKLVRLWDYLEVVPVGPLGRNGLPRDRRTLGPEEAEETAQRTRELGSLVRILKSRLGPIQRLLGRIMESLDRVERLLDENY